ncbi:hypothetical protein COV11_02375 [Candidatus Woesearchaeota archaeon CG10_big_fil_rev_8_21_14_0_10_30_7]|nr:MAG: hypothetical protein COV11_02375 [Candidatus Woesearchaeota archaeon CG10_big_fil_rev_8_21_14_0_10_30_7]
MVKVLEILKEFMKEVEKDNPFNLVLKGGTALALYYLNHHRESEDLDFDTEIHFKKDHEKIKKYLLNLLAKLKERKIITQFKITKASFSSTERYHMKLELETHKKIYSKIDIDFVDLPNNLIKKEKLNLYTAERLFVTKAVTFLSRKEFKDLYDLNHLIKKIKIDIFKKKIPVIKLLDNVLIELEKEDILKMFKLAFRNVDLKFKDLNESNLDKFIDKLTKSLRNTINKLKKLK